MASDSLRLDQTLVERGLIESREKARRAIMAGEVLVNGQQVDKPSHKTPASAVVELKARDRFVSRGGLKLEGALAHFAVEVGGKTCLDVGASTGGFTDCLLQRGAARVFAVDVGHGQLVWKLRQDPRVVVMEQVNARQLDPAAFTPPPQFACVDVSFISLTKILPALGPVMDRTSDLVALIKPQFEAGREVMDRCRGVLKDEVLQAQIVREISGFTETLGWQVRGTIPSPITGTDGNREFLLWAVKTGQSG
ncbi:MAG: TlyA family RNA methyltransferase [Verrucomicrobiae bacterium]|nr:TlyA family RNA methyltransferase [Verrucomicrobiae bacterium]